jgi:hypothetical protein
MVSSCGKLTYFIYFNRHCQIRTHNLTLGMLASHYPLVVPMEMRISQVKLRGIVVLVVDQEKGITLVFKNDPLESVLVNSVLYSSNSDIR